MKLEQLFPNFADQSDRDQLAFVRNYRNKRFMDLQTYTTEPEKKKTTKRKSTKKKSQVPMAAEDMEALKKLGFTAKQINQMRK
jgi:hypothetical protein